MNLDHVFKKTIVRKTKAANTRPEVPDGLLCKCNSCGSVILSEEVEKGYYICPKCGTYFRVSAKERIRRVADAGTFEEWDWDLMGGNPLDFPGYDEKIAAARLKTGLQEAVITGRCKIAGEDTVLCVMDGKYMMASMGKAVGEKITRAAERATEQKLPLVIFTCSGGARMQEGIISLMQMAKTSAAIKRHSDAGLLYISVLTDPTTGGVTASFAMLGDMILAEPKALIGFAGPRVIEQTIRQKLPKGFQCAEFLLEHGFVDRIVERREMRSVLGQLLKWHNRAAHVFPEEVTQQAVSRNTTISVMEKKSIADSIKTAWDRILLSRDSKRPVSSDYIEMLFDDFMEFHGDRFCKDDSAVIGGIAVFRGIPVTVIAQEKGKNTKDNIKRNFGMCSPDGYRKAVRLAKQAEKFGRPIFCFVDTPGAYCGIEAEERGQGEAIARSIMEMSSLEVPVLSLIIGEGGSGGALALATANEVWMLENSVYSILSPEGFSSILWKDSRKAKLAASYMKLTAEELKELCVIDHVFPEPDNFSRENIRQVTDQIARKISDFLKIYGKMDGGALAAHRYERYRRM
ncbi:MAG: acetyl-CoA carboxylase, carboxyltransferase subunit beta [Eubacteriales bacterium]|nr:acetyl-CoA carboxylase, carboxyltransferase subunit beta [Eubacteriales bacterium]